MPGLTDDNILVLLGEDMNPGLDIDQGRLLHIAKVKMPILANAKDRTSAVQVWKEATWAAYFSFARPNDLKGLV